MSNRAPHIIERLGEARQLARASRPADMAAAIRTARDLPPLARSYFRRRALESRNGEAWQALPGFQALAR